MDTKKIGALILTLRKEKGFTQKELADMLGVSDKAVSKWERGGGCPDISLWPKLSDILGADIKKLLEGELYPNKPNNGNLTKIVFYVCPNCGNILTTMGSCSVSCCGRRLAALKPQQANPDIISLSNVDGEIYLQFEHPMTKTNYITFVACVDSSKLILTKLYPEQNAETTFPASIRGRSIYFYSTAMGLLHFKVDKNMIK